MFARRTATTGRSILAALIMSIFIFGSTMASAQEPDPAYDLMVGVTGEAAEEIPDSTVSMAVFNEDQTVDVGSCPLVFSTNPGGCTVDVPPSTTIVAVVDETALPAGIVPVENPITYTTPAVREGLGDFSFEFVYADDSTPVFDYDLQLMFSGDPIADIPDGTVSVTVYNESGDVEYGSCAMNIGTKPGGCSVMVPSSTTVMAVLDESNLPEDIRVVENTVWYTTPVEKTELGDVWFELFYAETGDDGADDDIPAARDDPGGVTGLPSTGSGPTTAARGTTDTATIAAGSLALLIAGVSITSRLIMKQ